MTIVFLFAAKPGPRIVSQRARTNCARVHADRATARRYCDSWLPGDDPLGNTILIASRSNDLDAIGRSDKVVLTQP
ncbi:MAG: hypothetical protein DME22_03105 [Verrucomicrobia bacterium]|nr:MAG: hypothetical protein DME22_03105 [Verrucomicrobiota bacterium]PYK00609.1 MAG: hypothetical protein DME23_06720 [Verrucomicrobiota bacterium]